MLRAVHLDILGGGGEDWICTELPYAGWQLWVGGWVFLRAVGVSKGDSGCRACGTEPSLVGDDVTKMIDVMQVMMWPVSGPRLISRGRSTTSNEPPSAFS